MKNKNIINRVVYLLDSSGSMRNLKQSVIKVFNSQFKSIAQRSKELNQTTRVSIYTFNEELSNIIFDEDVNKVPDISNFYHPSGDTALIDATLNVIEEVRRLPELYGDFSTLMYIVSDGENRINNHLAPKLNKLITCLPDNWTIGFLAPDFQGVAEAKKFGFPSQNVSQWQCTEKGTEEMGRSMYFATDSYMIGRSKGVRSTNNLFNVDISSLSKTEVKNNLEQLNPKDYLLLNVYSDSPIKEYVENWTKENFIIGSAYYQLNKPEVIQSNKNIALMDKSNGKIYSGSNARNLIKLPNFDIKVNPASYGQWLIFCQSLSVNRKLIRGTQLLVMK